MIRVCRGIIYIPFGEVLRPFARRNSSVPGKDTRDGCVKP